MVVGAVAVEVGVGERMAAAGCLGEGIDVALGGEVGAYCNEELGG